MRILERLVSETQERRVTSAWIGFFTTAVVSSGSDGERCGLATTLRGGPCPGPVKGAGNLAGLPVNELARLVLTGRGPEVSLGMAAVNSALPPVEYETLNAEAIIEERGREKNIAVVGHFPFTDRLRALAGELWVVELEPRDADDLPPERMAGLLPRADAVAVSALTLLNGTLEPILASCRKDAFKIMLGPSAPLSPLLFDCGLDAVGGTIVTDAEALMRHLSQGANFQALPGKRPALIRKGG
jgi:uncharacterized protein (DUF4213/DUF364 family)